MKEGKKKKPLQASCVVLHLRPVFQTLTVPPQIKCTEVQPLIEGASMWQCTPDTWSNLCNWTYNLTHPWWFPTWRFICRGLTALEEIDEIMTKNVPNLKKETYPDIRSTEGFKQDKHRQMYVKTRMHAESLQSYLMLSNLRDCSLPAFLSMGILQTRILEWVAISYSRGSSWPRNQTSVSYLLHW